ncbi:Transcriptional regulator OS=Streptomyces fumanus OX=67302 GN=GCM10018772_33390 PE=3 SV=1 [Streptomyces fumanus]
MERQQRFLGALVNKVRGNDVLLNPVKAVSRSERGHVLPHHRSGPGELADLYALVRGLRDIPTERVQFLTVPREALAGNPNRDQLKEPDARELFARLRTDEPVAVGGSAPRRSDEKRTGRRPRYPTVRLRGVRRRRRFVE